ncbi:MAG: hypothetical protein EBT26_00870 [Microbacteriaceae bacterium]|nr:hypothetical protein [Microbacteriaceae bacterium]NBS60598.1 hypothetical protein [Microbacteriaceae bacterium]
MKMNKFIKHLKQQPKLGGTPSSTRNESTQTSPAGLLAATSNDAINSLARRLANQIIAERDQAQILARNGRTYTKFDPVNDVVSNQTEIVTAGLWSDNLASLTTYYTASSQTTSQRRYYTDIYQDTPTADGAAVQFSLAFGHALGSGSDSQGQLNDSPSRAIYSQYRQLLLAPTDTRFTTAGSGSTDYIYVINFKRNRLKERLDPGNWELPLINISSHTANATGSVVVSGTTIVTLIDDSSLASPKIGESGKVYNIVSGSINSGVYNSSAPVYYGLAYPDYGTLILDGKMLDQQLSFATNVSSSSEGNNHFLLYHSISGSATFTNPLTSDPYGFLARNSEKITSTHYFVRIKNAEYNFSNNPSYVTGSVGQISQTTFIGDPKTYVTTVGLYNDRQELLAVAKLSKPLLKSFQREALIRVKLDF